MFGRLLVISLLSGCSSIDMKAGISFYDEDSAYPEIDGLSSPFGIIRVEYETERKNDIFCEHISSLSESEDGHGLNHCGFLFKL